MNKIERYELNCMGYYCTDEDVQALEAKYAELLEAMAAIEVRFWAPMKDLERLHFTARAVIEHNAKPEAKCSGLELQYAKLLDALMCLEVQFGAPMKDLERMGFIARTAIAKAKGE